MPGPSISWVFRNPITVLISALIAAIIVYILFEDIYFSIALVLGGIYWILTSKFDIEDSITLPIVDKPTRFVIINGEIFDTKTLAPIQPVIAISFLIVFSVFVAIFFVIQSTTNFLGTKYGMTSTEVAHVFGEMFFIFIAFLAVHERVLIIFIKKYALPKQNIRIIKKDIATHTPDPLTIITGTLYLTEKYIAFLPISQNRKESKNIIIPLDSIKNANIAGDKIELECPDWKYIFSIDNASEFKSEIQKLRLK